MVSFAARGTHASEGPFSFANAIDDIGAALRWLQGPDGRALSVDPERIAIGGHSLGGGIAMAFAAHDSRTTPIVAIAGNDLGEFARRLRSDSALAAGLRARTSDAVVQEILDGESALGHTENAASLARRPILLLAGWDDATAPLETVVLPLYRALERQPESDVTIIAYQDGHFFGASREAIAGDIRAWLVRRFPR